MEVRAYFDLLKSFRQGTRRIDEWYNVVQAQINLAKYPPETAKILHRDICWFFLKDEEFVSKMINEGTMDLDKFPASRVHQPAKKMESSKARARHIKQVAGDPQATQINPMHHQHTELANGKYKKKKSSAKQKQVQHKNVEQRPPNQYKKSFDPTLAHKTKIGVASVEILLILKGSSAQQEIPLQGMAKAWPLHKPLLPEIPAKTSQLQTQETHCTSIEGWDHTCT